MIRGNAPSTTPAISKPDMETAKKDSTEVMLVMLVMNRHFVIWVD